jgi:hypothetical protein
MKRIGISWVAGVAMLSAGVLNAALIDVGFNETGTVATNAGTTSNFTLKNSSSANTDLHTADGFGVSGLAGDRAFDNSASASMGGSGGRAGSDINQNSGSLASFTLAGWFKTADTTQIGGGAALLVWQDADSALIVSSANSGKLSLKVNATTVESAASYTATQEWVFFAMTYDSTLGSNQAKFYVGGTNSAATLVSSLDLAGGAPDITGTITIGNQGNPIRAFDGLLDNFYLDSGAMDLQSIDAMRVAAIPEPATVGLFVISSSVLLFLRRLIA